MMNGVLMGFHGSNDNFMGYGWYAKPFRDDQQPLPTTTGLRAYQPSIILAYYGVISGWGQ